MSKAEYLAKEFLKKLASHTTLYKGTIDELEVYEPDDVIWAYKEGYHQAEKDLALTCLDIDDIIRIYEDVIKVKSGEDIYIEVLKRFKYYKERKER